MTPNPAITTAQTIKAHETSVLDEWVEQQLSSTVSGRISQTELREQSREFLNLFTQAIQGSNWTDQQSPQWSAVSEMLRDIARLRARQGFTPSEIATFIFSLKQPLFNCLRREGGENTVLDEQIWELTLLLDKLGIFTTEVYQSRREEIIVRQQQELLELSTPVVRLWENILALPLIGTLDSARTQVVMESLLEQIVQTGSSIAIIDITGVPTVDTLVAQHLLKTVAAARLMGADCIISGIRPQTAQTIVHLGVDLSQVITKATLADAFTVAMQRLDLMITRRSANTAPVAK